MHHQVFEDLPQSVQVLNGHLVADGFLVRRLALAKEAVCTGGRRTAESEFLITLMDQWTISCECQNIVLRIFTYFSV